MENYDDTAALMGAILMVSRRATEVWSAPEHYPAGWGDFLANTADRLRTILAKELLDLRVYTSESD